MTEHDDSHVVGREACPKCGSSDNLARYSDGHAYCFGAGCAYFEPPEDTNRERVDDNRTVPDALLFIEIGDRPARKLTAETCRRYSYGIASFRGETVQVATYRDSAGNPVAQKLRFEDKSKGMPWLGAPKEAALFGSHLAGKGKRIVVTEGEIDAMTVSQVMGNKWPVVSLKNGASGAARDMAANLEYLNGFDEIVLCFDMDEPGRIAAQEAAAVLPPKKVRIAELPLKDANECLVKDRGHHAGEIVPAIWNAKPWSPKNVIFGQEIYERWKTRPPIHSHPFPDWLPVMNTMALGIRMSELTVWTSGSGMGKTTLLKMLQLYVFNSTPWNQAVIHLEEPLEDTADDYVSIRLGKNLRWPEVAETVPFEEKDQAARDLFLSEDGDGSPRLVFNDAWGSVGDDDGLMTRIRYYATHHNCRVVWLDHLSILVSDMGEEGDERRRIDALMHRLSGLAVELDISIQLISHLKKAAGTTSFEEGAIPSLDDLRGSGGIKQLAMNVYAMSRNQQAKTELTRRTAQVHVLKCRRTGKTGPADFIEYNYETGLYGPGVDPEFTETFSYAAASGGALDRAF